MPDSCTAIRDNGMVLELLVPISIITFKTYLASHPLWIHMPTDTDDEVWNRAGSRYSAKLVHRSRLKKSTAFIENLALSALFGFPEVVVSSQDKVVVVDSRRTGSF
jgi:hypothetical protein